jgi:mannose/fructose-specific phosphotransferase system component IIA
MPVRGIIVTHAQLAPAFVTAIAQIAGPQEMLSAVSNVGLSNEQLQQKLRELMQDGLPTIIFTDFLGGSAYVVARQLIETCRSQEKAHCAAVTGVNLPMLLSFITKRNKLPFAELIETLRNDGHRGIQ